jgi:hypothetical protein
MNGVKTSSPAIKTIDILLLQSEGFFKAVKYQPAHGSFCFEELATFRNFRIVARSLCRVGQGDYLR